MAKFSSAASIRFVNDLYPVGNSYANTDYYIYGGVYRLGGSGSSYSDGDIHMVLRRDTQRIAFAATQGLDPFYGDPSSNKSVSLVYEPTEVPDGVTDTQYPWGRKGAELGLPTTVVGLRAILPAEETYPVWGLSSTTTPNANIPRLWAGEYSPDGSVFASTVQNGSSLYLSVMDGASIVANKTLLSITNTYDWTSGTEMQTFGAPKLVVHSSTNIWIFHRQGADVPNTRLFMSVWDGTTITSTTQMPVGAYNPNSFDVIYGDFGYSYLVYTLNDTSNNAGAGPVNGRIFVRTINHSTLAVSSPVLDTYIFDSNDKVLTIKGHRTNSNYVFRYKGKSYFLYAAPADVVAVYQIEDETPTSVTLLRYGTITDPSGGKSLGATRDAYVSVPKSVGIEYDPVSDTAYFVCVIPYKWASMPVGTIDPLETMRVCVVRHWQALDASTWGVQTEIVREMPQYVPELVGPYTEIKYISYPGYVPSRRGYEVPGLLWVQYVKLVGISYNGQPPTQYTYSFGLRVLRINNWYEPAETNSRAQVDLYSDINITGANYVAPDVSVDLSPGTKISGYRSRGISAYTYWGLVSLSSVTAEVDIPLSLGVSVEGKVPGVVVAETNVDLSENLEIYIAGKTLTIFIMQGQYLSIGTTFIDDFTSKVNEERASVWGLPPLQIMGRTADTLAVMEDADIAQIHCDNMASSRYYAHGASVFPLGWQTTNERLSKVTDLGSENLQLIFAEFGGLSHDQIPTADELWLSWKGSPTHYSNLMTDWGAVGGSEAAANVFSSLSVQYGRMPEYDGGGPPYDTYPAVPFPPEYTGNESLFALYWTNNFLVIKENQVDATLPQLWQTDALDALTLTAYWETSALIRCTVEHSSAYAVLLTQVNDAVYGPFVLSQHAILNTHSVGGELGVVYANSERMGSATNETSYDLSPLTASAEHELSWVQSAVVTSHDALYEDKASVRASVSSLYESMATVHANSTCVYAVRTGARAGHSVTTLMGPSVSSSSDMQYSLLLRNPASSAFIGVYDVLQGATATFLQPQTVAYLNGRHIEVQDGYISSDYDSPGYTFRCRSDDPLFVRGSKIGDKLDVLFEGTPYVFFLSAISTDSPNKSAAESVNIVGLSPVYLLGAPYAETATYAPDSAKMFSAIVQESLGIPVDFGAHIDWMVPPNRAQISNQTPLDSAISLLSSVGSRLLSRPDGSVYVKARYEVGMNTLPTGHHTITFDELPDIFSRSSSYEYATGYNRYRVHDSESRYEDKIEFDEETSVVSVWVSPYRSSWRLACTTTVGILLDAQGEVVEEKEDMWDFSAGSCNAAYPILDIVSLVWVTDALGGVSFDPYSTRVTVSVGVNFGYGLAKVVYRTKYSKFLLISSVSVEATQLIIVEN